MALESGDFCESSGRAQHHFHTAVLLIAEDVVIMCSVAKRHAMSHYKAGIDTSRLN